MSEDFIRFEKRGRVAWVTLNRPEVMNALHPPCHDRLEAIWDEFEEEDFALPADEPLVLAAFDAGPPTVAYVEPVAVGDRLPDMPLFLRPEHYVSTPLEATYEASWRAFPGVLKGLLETTESRPRA